MKLVLATGNPGKVREMDQTLASLGFHVISQRELDVTDAVEDGLSFIENALIKARHASAATGLPAVADDSGLAVDALGGAPGIYSARYAGENADDQANNEKLLHTLADTPEADRGAQFICALAYVRNAEDPVPVIAEGVWRGRILFKARGENGFGYDPLFWVAAENCSSAELPPERKQSISHRAQALKILRTRLMESLNLPLHH